MKHKQTNTEDGERRKKKKAERIIIIIIIITKIKKIFCNGWTKNAPGNAGTFKHAETGHHNHRAELVTAVVYI